MSTLPLARSALSMMSSTRSVLITALTLRSDGKLTKIGTMIPLSSLFYPRLKLSRLLTLLTSPLTDGTNSVSRSTPTRELPLPPSSTLIISGTTRSTSSLSNSRLTLVSKSSTTTLQEEPASALTTLLMISKSKWTWTWNSWNAGKTFSRLSGATTTGQGNTRRSSNPANLVLLNLFRCTSTT